MENEHLGDLDTDRDYNVFLLSGSGEGTVAGTSSSSI
jgi:hypothetical protein